jgi:hypothetical protein
VAVVGVHVLGAAGQILSGRLQRLALGAAWRPATGVQVISGILAGPANTQGELSLAGGVLTVQPFRAVIQSALDATAGSYLIPNDAPASFTLTAQHASQYRRSLVVVRVDDSQVSGVASTATTDRGVLEVLDGALAASQAATVLPTPAGSWLALGEVLIPPTGQTVTLTPYNPRTGTRHGILPVIADGSTITGHDGTPPAYDGQARYHPTYGLQLGVAGTWTRAADVQQPAAIYNVTQSSGQPSGSSWGVGTPGAPAGQRGGFTNPAPVGDRIQIPNDPTLAVVVARLVAAATQQRHDHRQYRDNGGQCLDRQYRGSDRRGDRRRRRLRGQQGSSELPAQRRRRAWLLFTSLLPLSGTLTHTSRIQLVRLTATL